MIHKGKAMIQISEAKEIKALIYGVLEDFFQQSSIRSHTLLNPYFTTFQSLKFLW